MTIQRFQTLKRCCIGLGAMASALSLSSTPAQAAGDLLVAPTRVVLDGQRGTEVILNNIGSETATYRISLELRRMTSEGRLEDVSEEQENDIERAAKEMIRYAPRRVTLPPNQPQAIRLGVRRTGRSARRRISRASAVSRHSRSPLRYRAKGAGEAVSPSR